MMPQSMTRGATCGIGTSPSVEAEGDVDDVSARGTTFEATLEGMENSMCEKHCRIDTNETALTLPRYMLCDPLNTVQT